jgi:hypothetical protein
MRLLNTIVRNTTIAVLLIGAVFILGCTGSTEGNTLTGNAIAVEGVKTWVSCTETDKNDLGKGNNALKAGTTSVEYRRAGNMAEKSSYADRCSGKKVIEYYCDGKRARYSSLNCEQFGKGYVCKNNACVKG